MKLEIYTDGSHFKSTDKIGYGAWFESGGKEYSLSGIASQQKFKDRFNITDNVSNPTMELMAVLATLNEFKGKEIDLIVYSDYIGVQKWINGEWKAKKPYIKSILEDIKSVLKTINGEVEFKWVKGHSGNYGNDKVDEIAKSREKWSNINEFFGK